MYMQPLNVSVRRFPINIMLKHEYEVSHCSFRTLFYRMYRQALTVQNVPNRSSFWTVSKNIGQLAKTTQNVVFS